MIAIPSGVRVLIATKPVDFRKGMDGLAVLVQEVLKQWQGPLPRLSYVTDSGDNETAYYDKVLAKMKHPRTGEKLEWIRVADYYHVSERLWTMAEMQLSLSIKESK